MSKKKGKGRKYKCPQCGRMFKLNSGGSIRAHSDPRNKPRDSFLEPSNKCHRIYSQPKE